MQCRILYIDDSGFIFQKKGRIFRKERGEKKHSKVLSPNSSSRKNNFFYNIYIISRLLRKGTHHFISLNENQSAVIYDKRLCIADGDRKKFDVPLPGSRPLSFEKIGGEIVFGEYRSNIERSPVSVYAIDLTQEPTLKRKFTFKNIRHIHGVYQDTYNKTIYITTGDENHEAAIYKTEDDFRSVEKVLSGSQQTRVIRLLFDENFIYFGSDAPHEKNHLYKLDKETKALTHLADVGSPVFHGCKIKNWFFFSTAIEPSQVNISRHAELWASPDGDMWKCILRLKKDFLSMRYFQYGQIRFPNGAGDNKNLWISPLATKWSNKTIQIPLNRVEEFFKKNSCYET